jgi:hypothetical protein
MVEGAVVAARIDPLSIVKLFSHAKAALYFQGPLGDLERRFCGGLQ